MDKPLNFDDLRRANLQREREWDPAQKLTMLFHSNELAGETGEACNKVKKLERQRLGLRGTRATTTELAEELADVVIVVDLIAIHGAIDLGKAVREKFNATSTKYGLKTMFVDESKLPTDYPEITKMHKIKDKSQAIGEFLEWLGGQGLFIATHHTHNAQLCRDEDGDMVCELNEDSIYRHYESIEKILARHFNIDLDKVEAEKQAMLASIRSANETH